MAPHPGSSDPGSNELESRTDSLESRRGPRLGSAGWKPYQSPSALRRVQIRVPRCTPSSRGAPSAAPIEFRPLANDPCRSLGGQRSRGRGASRSTWRKARRSRSSHPRQTNPLPRVAGQFEEAGPGLSLGPIGGSRLLSSSGVGSQGDENRTLATTRPNGRPSSVHRATFAGSPANEGPRCRILGFLRAPEGREVVRRAFLRRACAKSG
jgi:hypothetical protein